MQNCRLSVPAALVAAVLGVSVSAAAQGEAAFDPAALRAAPDFSIPPHRGPDGHEVWAAGRDYKASFHDGFVFWPRPPAADRPATPFAWRLVGVTAGGRELVTATEGTPTPQLDGRRVEIRRGAVTEVYEVRADGVEQSFVLHRRPTAPGDVVVRGLVQTDLTPPPAAERHGALTFGDAGTTAVGVRYGAAWVFDAAGRRANVTTAFADGVVELRVDGAWLADATYPVTIDPLTSLVQLQPSNVGFFDRYYEALVRHDPVADEYLLVFGHTFGNSDIDCYAYVTDPNFGNPQLVFSDLGVGKTAQPGGVAFVRGTSRWVVAYTRFTPGTSSQVKIYVHDSGNTTLNSGTTLTVTPPTGSSYFHSDVGGTHGTSSGDRNALVVFERSTGVASDVEGLLVETVGAPSVVGPVTLDPTPAGATWERERPSVSPSSDGASGSWAVVWQERDVQAAGDDWELRGARVTHAGSRAGVADLAQTTSGPPHATRPVVAGSDGRYLVAFLRSNSATATSGDEVATQRFDWSETSAMPTTEPVVTVDGSPLVRMGDVAFDTRTRSHWAVVHHRGGFPNPIELVVSRLGMNAGVTESADYPAPTSGFGANFDDPGIAFDAPRRRFAYAHTYQDTQITGLTTAELWARHLTYPTTATATAYGSNCGGRILAPEPPYRGHSFFSVDLALATPNTFAVLEISAAPFSLPLAFIGMPNCFQLVDPNPGAWIVGLTTMTDGAGRASVDVPVMDWFDGDLYFMYGFIASGANPLGVLATRGLRVQFR